MKEHLKRGINNFHKKRVLIVGDVMLDKYISGDVSRISPEASIPVVKVKKENYVLGGAGNVASNIISLGAKCVLVSSIGDDKEGVLLKKLLKNKGIKSKLTIVKKPTIVKTRIIGTQQLLRVDYENTDEIHSSELLKAVRKEVKNCDIVIISDYAKGVITKKLVEEIVSSTNVPIIADPKHSEISYYRGVSIITPNESESYSLSLQNVDVPLVRVAKILEEELNCKTLITRAEKGLSLLKDDNLVDIPTVAQEVYDVSGAGDTVISVLALAISSGASLEESAIIANHAAGIVVSKFGTATVSKNELLSKFEEEDTKIKTFDEIVNIRKKLKKTCKKVVFTNGCFDILHVGHVKLLRKAKAFGDVLILGLNTDKSIERLKGPERPIIKENERAEMLAALEIVDYIVFFNEDTPVEIVKKIKPNIHVKGGDYKKNDMPETRFVEKYGGKVEILPLVKGFSTTNIIEKIKNEKA